MQNPYILTNHPGHNKSKTWATASQYFERNRSFPFTLLNNLATAIGMFRRRLNYKAVVLGGGAQVDMFYMILQRLWPFNVRPVIKVDCLWYYSSPVKHFFKKNFFRWLDKIVSCYVVWATREIEDYSEAFGLPREKFTFIPYHTTADLKNIQIDKGDYIFSGGNFARDYLTLAKAVDGLDVDVLIACTNSEALNGIQFPSHVKIVGVSHSEFMDLMARSGVNVVPLTKGLLHSGAQQTFLNAMAMGKTVIVTDPEGAKDYIDDRVDGILVEPSDPDKLRNAILQIINDSAFSEEIGMAASRKAGLLDTETHLAAIVSLSRKYI